MHYLLSITLSGIQTSRNHREAPRTCRPSPTQPAAPPFLVREAFSVLAERAAEAHPHPLPFGQLSDGKGAGRVAAGGPCAGPGAGRGRAPARGQRGFHRSRLEPGWWWDTVSSTDSVIQHCSTSATNQYDLRRAAADEQWSRQPEDRPPPPPRPGPAPRAPGRRPRLATRQLTLPARGSVSGGGSLSLPAPPPGPRVYSP